MPAKLLDYEVVKGEKRWTKELKIVFNGKKISFLTITDHYQKDHGKVVNNELIIRLVKKLNNKRLRPYKFINGRKPYKWETVCQHQPYRLIFWFKDNTANHLWIRNCYPID
ncbi:MAG: hypothetical protein LBR43_03620 [Spiroplasmataceae bacterium]|jgi:hypothetical protein|nr:hypothetical protein [Spiroplasmataceae bacterium]